MALPFEGINGPTVPPLLPFPPPPFPSLPSPPFPPLSPFPWGYLNGRGIDTFKRRRHFLGVNRIYINNIILIYAKKMASPFEGINAPTVLPFPSTPFPLPSLPFPSLGEYSNGTLKGDAIF